MVAFALVELWRTEVAFAYHGGLRHAVGTLRRTEGGEGEIRTRGGLSSSTVFKTAALNRSATSP